MKFFPHVTYWGKKKKYPQKGSAFKTTAFMNHLWLKEQRKVEKVSKKKKCQKNIFEKSIILSSFFQMKVTLQKNYWYFFSLHLIRKILNMAQNADV